MHTLPDLSDAERDAVLQSVAHRPYPLPAGLWRMRQRWNDLLFAHWPIPPAEMAALLPAGLELDTFDDQAWVGVVPFWMDQVRNRVIGQKTLSVPTTTNFAELNLRTYVRSPRTGLRGVYFFSLDCTSPLAVFGARTIFHLPYFVASMQVTGDAREGIDYVSQRRLSRAAPKFAATYRSLGPPAPPAQAGTLTHFLTERYCLFTPSAGRILRGDIHHLPWPLEPAAAEMRVNELPAAHGLTLPSIEPVVHLSRALQVFIWPLKQDVL